jgi:hypothetical protein
MRKILAALALALVVLGAGHLPEVDDLYDRAPAAVRAYVAN